MSQLECKNLTLGYDGRVVLQDLSFSVEKGSYLCILGDNGSGKTTLMKTILGLHSPVSGSVRTGDGLSRSQIGYLPQQSPLQRDFPASVREIVLSGFAGKGGLRLGYTRKEKEICANAMERMGIARLARRCYRELSGGQQQRVLLARALCAADKMLLLDEPVAGLDPSAAEEMYDLIQKINRDGITVIMISHDVACAQRYADHILHIGDPMFYGRTEDYIECDCCRREHGTKGDLL